MRRTLRAQIARLERELSEQRCSHWPRGMRDRPVPCRNGSGPGRLLSSAELERLRDALVDALAAERRALAERTLAEDEARRLREELMCNPTAYAGVRVSHADVGEPGCGAVRSEPACGLLGRLMGWWRVVVSSGCP